MTVIEVDEDLYPDGITEIHDGNVRIKEYSGLASGSYTVIQPWLYPDMD